MQTAWLIDWLFQQLMFPNYDHGRFSVIDDGTLVIESVMKEDAGEYVCKGLSIAGSAYAKARLEVRGMGALALNNILIECPALTSSCNKRFTASSMKDLFDNVAVRNIINFIKESHFYSTV